MTWWMAELGSGVVRIVLLVRVQRWVEGLFGAQGVETMSHVRL
jgi:hypothetical protein